MAYLVEDASDGQRAFKTLLVRPKNLNVLNSDLALKILQNLSERPACAMDIARGLNQHEQKIYYHLRRLEHAGIVKLIRREERVGGLAKIYSVSQPYVSIKLFDSEPLVDVKTRAMEIEFFHPFIKDGRLDATIAIGSPDPHGKYGAQASDGCCAIDLALFLGSFLKKTSLNYKLDTEIREKDLEGNLILIGGPKANMIIESINKKLPVYFDTVHEFNVVSSFSKSVYAGDDIGIIVRMKNPYAKEKEILILSGKRFVGTRASIIGLVKHLREIETGNRPDGNIARVVRGIDRDSDGRIDDVEFLE